MTLWASVSEVFTTPYCVLWFVLIYVKGRTCLEHFIASKCFGSVKADIFKCSYWSSASFKVKGANDKTGAAGGEGPGTGRNLRSGGDLKDQTIRELVDKSEPVHHARKGTAPAGVASSSGAGPSSTDPPLESAAVPHSQALVTHPKVPT